MVRIRTDLPNTSLWREDAPQWRAPLGSLRRHSTTVVRRRSFAETPLAVHRPSACSANLIAGDGTKNGLSRSEQRTGSRTQKQPLDRKSPIQVTCEPDFLAFRRSPMRVP